MIRAGDEAAGGDLPLAGDEAMRGHLPLAGRGVRT